ncbi:MAG: thiol-disulfide oxidoreductase DCC family protein [Oligoflexales bacterium]
MTGPKDNPIVFFDGVCGLCDRIVTFLFQRDKSHVLRFAPLQGTTAASRLDDKLRKDLDSLVYVHENTVLRKSDAVIEACVQLGGLWKSARYLLVIPQGLRNLCYDLVASNRYQIFGKKEACRLPSLDEKQYFFD